MTPPLWHFSKNSSDLVAGPFPNDHFDNHDYHDTDDDDFDDGGGEDDDVEGKDDDDVEGMAVEGMVRLSVGMQLEVPTVQGDPVKDRNRLPTHFYR